MRLKEYWMKMLKEDFHTARIIILAKEPIVQGKVRINWETGEVDEILYTS